MCREKVLYGRQTHSGIIKYIYCCLEIQMPPAGTTKHSPLNYIIGLTRVTTVLSHTRSALHTIYLSSLESASAFARYISNLLVYMHGSALSAFCEDIVRNAISKPHPSRHA